MNINDTFRTVTLRLIWFYCRCHPVEKSFLCNKKARLA